MATKVSRFFDQNLVKLTTSILTADSVYASLPVRFLLDQLRSKPWRSGGPWVIISGWNDAIEAHTVGPDFTAHVAQGIYETAAALCTAIVNALEAAQPTPVWACTYNTSTFKFTISADVTFDLRTANEIDHIWRDIGYNVGADKTGATSYISDNVSYQSRHYVAVDLGSAMAAQSAWLVDTNLSAGAVVVLNSSVTSIMDALTAPDATQTLVVSANGELALKHFNSQSYRFNVIEIYDGTNADAFAEVGVFYLGVHRQTSRGYSIQFQEEGDDLSDVTQATEGALFGNQGAEAPAWVLIWANVLEADADIFRAFRTNTPKGKCFGFAFDAGVDDTDFVYCYRDGPLAITTENGGKTWNVTLVIKKALP